MRIGPVVATVLLVSSIGSAQKVGPALWPRHAELGKWPVVVSQSKIEGKVLVNCYLKDDGSVGYVDVSGHPTLAEASGENSRHWSFYLSKHKPSEHFVVQLTYEYQVLAGGKAGTVRASIELPHRVVVRIESGEPNAKE